MLEQFYSTICVAWVAGQIAARYNLEPTLAYHLPLVQTLVDVLNGSVGVFVYWGVYESGKSTAAREAVATASATGQAGDMSARI
jgi:CHASE1-domain containing sensor protein